MGRDDDPVVSFDEVTPPHINATVALYQQVMKRFDEMNTREQHLMFALICSFVKLTSDEQRVIVAASEKLAGL